jgi:hypothetical protein
MLPPMHNLIACFVEWAFAFPMHMILSQATERGIIFSVFLGLLYDRPNGLHYQDTAISFVNHCRNDVYFAARGVVH